MVKAEGVYDEEFQYMLLLRGATRHCFSPATAGAVSIHAPLARSNSQSIMAKIRIKNVSIHAPLARSNQLFPQSRQLKPCPFQYMLLLRGATAVLPLDLS